MLKNQVLSISCDGGARGNPGPGGIGVVIRRKGNSKIVERIGKFVGLKVTNNQTEYLGVIESLRAAEKYEPRSLEIFLDSELVVRQLNGQYKVKNAGLKMYWQEIQELIERFEEVKFSYVPREKNKEADKLVNQVLDELDL